MALKFKMLSDVNHNHDDLYAKIEDIPTKVSELENDKEYINKTEADEMFERLNSNTALKFYCIEDVTIIVNGESTTYPANSNVEIKLLSTDEFEIITTSDNSILSLSAFPGAINVFYNWLNGVKQFSNILFDMNTEDMYTKWNQGNQGANDVQFAQYVNCIFWSDNPYINDIAIRTNYTLYQSSQVPLCYSTIRENTYKPFYLAYGVQSDPNWVNDAYIESFALTTSATAPFSYYGARTIGLFNLGVKSITLPSNCQGLMFYSYTIENAGVFDAAKVTSINNFGAKKGSWREAFGYCYDLKRLYIKNLNANLNLSWSPIERASINYIVNNSAATKAIKIWVSPYTYNLLTADDISNAADKNITIILETANTIEDKRVNAIDIKGDGQKVLTNDGTYKTLNSSYIDGFDVIENTSSSYDLLSNHVKMIVRDSQPEQSASGEVEIKSSNGVINTLTLNVNYMHKGTVFEIVDDSIFIYPIASTNADPLVAFLDNKISQVSISTDTPLSIKVINMNRDSLI